MKFIQWLTSLLTKESKPMTNTLAVSAAGPTVVVTPTTSATAVLKDLTKAYEFIKSGTSYLGAGADGALLALAKKSVVARTEAIKMAAIMVIARLDYQPKYL